MPTPTAARAPQSSAPVSTMNMTPLIDVLLVLLIMFIITIPIATHALEVDVGAGEGIVDTVDRVQNKIVITASGTILWNGTPVTKKQLAALLNTSTKMEVEPELQFEPEADASYEVSADVLRIIKISGVTKFGFVGNEKYRKIERPTG